MGIVPLCTPIPFALSRSFHSVPPIIRGQAASNYFIGASAVPDKRPRIDPFSFRSAEHVYRIVLRKVSAATFSARFSTVEREIQPRPTPFFTPFPRPSKTTQCNLIPSSFQQGSWLSRVESSPPLVCQIFPLGKLRDFPPWREIFSLYRLYTFYRCFLTFSKCDIIRESNFYPPKFAHEWFKHVFIFSSTLHPYLSISKNYSKFVNVNFHFEARFRVTRKIHDVFSFRVLQISIQRKKEKEIGNYIYYRRKNIVYLRSCLEWNTYTFVSRKCRGALSIDKAQQRRWGKFNGVNKISRVM